MTEADVKRPIHTDWRRRFFRFSLWQVLYRFWFRLRIGGWENIPRSGPVLMAGNHIHALDPVVMISVYPDRDVVPLAKIESWVRPMLIRFFVRNWGAIPVMRGEADTRAMKEVMKTIEDGKIGMLYIEGTRSKTGLIEGQVGTAFIALHTDAAIVPIAIWGTRSFPSGWWREMRRVRITMNFGRPFRLKKPEGRSRDHLPLMTEEIMYRIARILPEEWRGQYSDLSKATTDYLDFDIDWEPPETSFPGWVTTFTGEQWENGEVTG